MKIRLLSGFGKWIMAGGYCYCLVAGLVACTPDRGQVNVIPLPNDMEIKEGFFEIDSTRFVNEGADSLLLAILIRLLIMSWEMKDMNCLYLPGLFI